MSTSLLTLQPELHLMIAAALGPDLTGLGDDDVQAKYNKDGDSAPTRETQIQQREKESRGYLVSWSCTSKYFRSLLASRLFTTLILRNDEKNAASVQTVAKKPEYVSCVKTLRFIGYAPGDAKSDEPEFSDVDNILPEKVKNTLADLKRFANLEKLSVEFDYNFEDYGEWEEEGVDTVGVTEDDDEMREKEKVQAWRALMVKVWEAACANQGAIKSLAINRLYYKKVSTYANDDFHRFLGTLEDFSLSIWAGENGAGWNTNTCQNWADFIVELDSYFFNHLQNVTSFTFKASEEAPIGLEGMNHALLVLRKEHMPKLQHLHLEYIFLGPELRDFLVGKAGTLETVHLRSCLAEIDDGMAEGGLHWHETFNAFASARPTKLRAVKISEDRPAPLPSSGADWGENGSDIDEDIEERLDTQAEEARKQLETGRRRVWAHVSVDDKYGMIFEQERDNLINFTEGRDQEAFGRLMDIVSKNVQAMMRM